MKLKAFKQAVATRYVRAVLLACCCCCVALLLLRVWLRSRCPASCLRHQYARMQCTHIHRVSTYILYIDIRRYTSTAPAGCCARVERELSKALHWLAGVCDQLLWALENWPPPVLFGGNVPLWTPLICSTMSHILHIMFMWCAEHVAPREGCTPAGTHLAKSDYILQHNSPGGVQVRHTMTICRAWWRALGGCRARSCCCEEN